jgi:hypothetical protein
MSTLQLNTNRLVSHGTGQNIDSWVSGRPPKSSVTLTFGERVKVRILSYPNLQGSEDHLVLTERNSRFTRWSVERGKAQDVVAGILRDPPNDTVPVLTTGYPGRANIPLSALGVDRRRP